MKKPEIIENLKSVFGIEPTTISDLTDEQKDALHEYEHGIATAGILYTDTKLIFTNEPTYKNWQDVAGFEHLEREPDTYKVDSTFIAIYDAQFDTDNRIQDFLDIIKNA